MMMSTGKPITGVILAGGQGRRFGQRDKGWVQWRGSPLIEHVITRLQDQVDGIRISCNRNTDRYLSLGHPICTDTPKLRYQGPLAGVYAALCQCPTPYAVVVPCDTPLLPNDLVIRLSDTMHRRGAAITYAHDGQREQYLFALIHTRLRDSLHCYLETGGRSVKGWYALNGAQAVDFTDQAGSFTNINRESDLPGAD